MTAQSLGYLGVRAKDLGDWGSYGSGMLGLQRIDKSARTMAFRMDDRQQRIIVDADGGEGLSFFGWEVADASALDAVAARLEKAGVPVARGSRALADERRVKDLIVTNDPVGNRLELFYGAETTAEPFKPGRSISGFRTGPLGLGHVVMHTANTDEMVRFYRDLLGFRLTDYYSSPFKATFMHLNPRHHSLAFIETGKNAVHHMMMELYSFDDVGQGYDIAQREIASPPRSAATPAITSRPSIRGRRRTSWWNTAGAPAISTSRTGRRTSGRRVPACGATTAPGCRRTTRTRRARSASPMPTRASASPCR